MDKRIRQLSLMQKKLSTIHRCSKERNVDISYCDSVPSAIGIKLTNRCNLRCKHCFEWSINGYHHSMEKKEISINGDISIEKIKELLDFTRSTNAPLYLWGGEPTIYYHWDSLCCLICDYDRDVVICTNGIDIIQMAPSFCSLGERITLLFSVEGFPEQHNAIRGKGTYDKTIEAIEYMTQLRKEGIYKGFLSIETVISDNLIPYLVEYCYSYENIQIDALYLNFPWFINQKVVNEMDDYFITNLSKICSTKRIIKQNYSWHSFDFHISEELIPTLLENLSTVHQTKYSFKVYCNPNICGDELVHYLKGDDILKESKTMCLSYSQRIDILPNGDICPCKKYPELAIGNIYEGSIESLWEGEKFNKFRKALNNKLMPICSKCELFYAYNI